MKKKIKIRSTMHSYINLKTYSMKTPIKEYKINKNNNNKTDITIV